VNAKLNTVIEGAILLAVLVTIVVTINTYVITGTDTGSTLWRTISGSLGILLAGIGVAILILRGVMNA
jgi:hypothetical protein